MSNVQTQSRAIEWQRKMQTRGGKIGHYQGICPLTKKHRLQTSNKYREYNPSDQTDTYTTWLLDDAGYARGDRQHCAEDCVGPA